VKNCGACGSIAPPITLDIIENALKNARFEMDGVVVRVALSPVIREQHDEFPMICNERGQMVVGQFGSYIPAIVEKFEGDINEGDVFVWNDPYACKGSISHNNDWCVMMPIFHEGTLVGFSSIFGHMVDVGGKEPMRRRAVARAEVRMAAATARILRELPKGDALATAQVAGIMAAKRTSELIPLCHPLPLTHVEVTLEVGEASVEIVASAETTAQTGVEMEALTAVTVAASEIRDGTRRPWALSWTRTPAGWRLSAAAPVLQ